MSFENLNETESIGCRFTLVIRQAELAGDEAGGEGCHIDPIVLKRGVRSQTKVTDVCNCQDIGLWVRSCSAPIFVVLSVIWLLFFSVGFQQPLNIRRLHRHAFTGPLPVQIRMPITTLDGRLQLADRGAKQPQPYQLRVFKPFWRK